MHWHWLNGFVLDSIEVLHEPTEVNMYYGLSICLCRHLWANRSNPMSCESTAFYFKIEILIHATHTMSPLYIIIFYRGVVLPSFVEALTIRQKIQFPLYSHRYSPLIYHTFTAFNLQPIRFDGLISHDAAPTLCDVKPISFTRTWYSSQARPVVIV